MYRRHRRSQNFSRNEITALIDGVNKRISVINARQKNGCRPTTLTGTTATYPMRLIKRRAWEEIAADVSAAGGMDRSVDEIKKKWANIRLISQKRGEGNIKSTARFRPGSEPALDNECQQMILNTLCRAADEDTTGDNLGCDTRQQGDQDEAGPEEANATHTNTTHIKAELSDETVPPSNEIEERTSEPPVGLYCTSVGELQWEPEPHGSEADTFEQETPKTFKVELISILKKLVYVEEERCNIEKQRLEIERQRLDMERSRQNEVKK
ncbi:uncharacterized protein [Antedon mediterranea]|uniref:uncharacterized protein n=1 Tax=Antedon mediterranea TaxID=105859 RepID=UPI003AF44D34